MTKVAMLTGGASGIGRASCTRLAADGFTLAVCDLDPDGAAAAAGPGGLGRAVDVADAAAVDAFVAEVTDRFGRIDVLVNNAGISGSPEATVLHSTPVAEWDRVFGVNVPRALPVLAGGAPGDDGPGAGHVITIASVAGQVAFPGRSAYTASKGAALQLARSIAVDYAGHGIRTNAVCPGMRRDGDDQVAPRRARAAGGDRGPDPARPGRRSPTMSPTSSRCWPRIGSAT